MSLSLSRVFFSQATGAGQEFRKSDVWPGSGTLRGKPPSIFLEASGERGERERGVNRRDSVGDQDRIEKREKTWISNWANQSWVTWLEDWWLAGVASPAKLQEINYFALISKKTAAQYGGVNSRKFIWFVPSLIFQADLFVPESHQVSSLERCSALNFVLVKSDAKSSNLSRLR